MPVDVRMIRAHEFVRRAEDGALDADASLALLVGAASGINVNRASQILLDLRQAEPELDVLAWVVDDTGIAKQGKHSPGVKRQYSGTLGKIGNCQITVSVHAVGAQGTLPLGWSLYLPEEWCADELRRGRARGPAPARPGSARGWDRAASPARVCGRHRESARKMLPFPAARRVSVMASAAAVASSSREAPATPSPVRSATMVWKFSSASSRPCEISGW